MKELKTAFLIVGAIIGAGFASGKEIYVYFAKYGGISFLFLIPLFFLIFLFTKTFLSLGNLNKQVSISSINNSICPSFSIFNKKVNILNIFMFFTFLIICSAMFSGLEALVKTYFPYLNQTVILIVVIVITMIFLKFSFSSLASLSAIVVPLIICGILLLSLAQQGKTAFDFVIQSPHNLPILTILYASQNMFLASFAIVDAGKTNVNSTKVGLYVASIICILLFVGILCFFNNPQVCELEMPFAEISKSINPAFSVIFGVVIFFSIITTYITSLASLKEFFKGEKKYNKSSVMLLVIVLLSLLNFGTIIQYLYPIIGIFGVVYMLFARFKGCKNI